MKFHSIPELYVRLRIPFDTQTWLKKTREFYVFLRCPWSTHVMSTRWPSWNPLRKQRQPFCGRVVFRSVVDGSEMRTYFRRTSCGCWVWANLVYHPKRTLFGYWIQYHVMGNLVTPEGGGCGSRHTGINLSTSTSSIKSALADAATCCHLTQTVPCCHLTKPASCWLQLRAAGGASTWRCLPPLQRMEWANLVTAMFGQTPQSHGWEEDISLIIHPLTTGWLVRLWSDFYE